MPNNVAQDARSHSAQPLTAFSGMAGDIVVTLPETRDSGMARCTVTLPETPAGEDGFNRMLSLFERELRTADRRCRWSYAGNDEKTFHVTYEVPISMVARVIDIAHVSTRQRMH